MNEQSYKVRGSLLQMKCRNFFNPFVEFFIPESSESRSLDVLIEEEDKPLEDRGIAS